MGFFEENPLLLVPYILLVVGAYDFIKFQIGKRLRQSGHPDEDKVR